MPNEIIVVIFKFTVLFFAMTVHEVSHGVMAYKLGDNTAKLMGRLSFNPLRHIDPFGSVVFPLFLMAVGSPILFMWAKPVIYNPINLKNPKLGAALIGLAGPFSNMAVAVILGIVMRILALVFDLQANLGAAIFVYLLGIIVFINILFAIFNLIPIPPLDGSKVLFGFLPANLYGVQEFLERYGIFIFLIFIFYGLDFVGAVTGTVFNLITGSIMSF